VFALPPTLRESREQSLTTRNYMRVMWFQRMEQGKSELEPRFYYAIACFSNPPLLRILFTLGLLILLKTP
jgi:hypothetical protein